MLSKKLNESMECLKFLSVVRGVGGGVLPESQDLVLSNLYLGNGQRRGLLLA